MYSLLAILVSVPLYFSHVFSPLGIIVWDVSSFERQKIYLFILLTIVAIIEWCIRFPNSIFYTLKRYFFIIILCILLPIFSSFFTGTDIFSASNLLGSYEKHHGYIFYIGTILFTILMISSPVTWIKKYMVGSLIATGIVACVAIWERMGSIFDIYGRSEMLSLYTWRSSSTLGNPNYVAGYLLMFIPIVASHILQYRKYRWIYLILLLFIVIAIYLTGSYIGLYIVFALFFYYNIRYIFSDLAINRQLVIFFSFLAMITYAAFVFIDKEKLLSLESRFILMNESLGVLFSNPVWFFIGFWSESILQYFSQVRSILINSYFPSSMLIDSSHNMIIDIIFQYGIFPIVIFMWFLYKNWHKILTPVGLSILLGILFLSLNVMVVSHVLVLILMIVTLSYQDNKKSR
jgi:hypothetical protein